MTAKTLSLAEHKRQRIADAADVRTPAQASKRAIARTRAALAELSEANIDRVQTWLDEVANGDTREVLRRFDKNGEPVFEILRAPDPARALDLLLKMIEYTTPKLRAVAVEVSNPDGSLRQLTIADLQRMLSEQPAIDAEYVEIPDAARDLL